MEAKYYIAVDLGAESGRVMLGRFEGSQISLEEIHRFPNTPVPNGDHLYWDIEALQKNILEGLARVGSRGIPVQSMSCDTWGVDYILFDEEGEIINPTYHYRDPRGAEGVKRSLEWISWPELFQETGIQHMPLNSFYQLAMESKARLDRTHHWLLVGDGLLFWLSGVARAEVSLASTSQLYNPVTRNWSERLAKGLALPERVLPEIVPSGSVLGPLKGEWQKHTGLHSLKVIASCSHDTAAAVAAVPAEGDSWVYLSSGTWSLMGVEVQEPILTDACREMNFTNEIGYGGRVRLLKNIIGLWLVQQCRKVWKEEGKDLSYAELTQLAAQAEGFKAWVNPADPRFLAPRNMVDAIQGFCRETNQFMPQTPGQIIRCVLESLALLYRHTLKQLETLLGRQLEVIHIVGGGCQNEILNHLTADACQRTVLAGPVEATALGNVLVQALALGDVENLDQGRKMVAHSSSLVRYNPSQVDLRGWDEGYTQLLTWLKS